MNLTPNDRKRLAIIGAVLLSIIAVFAVLILLSQVATFVTPIFLGINLVIAVMPLQQWLLRIGTPKVLAALAAALPDSARNEGGDWIFELPGSGPEPLLKALIDGGAGIETLAIERPGLHDAFVAIAGEAAASAMGIEEIAE